MTNKTLVAAVGLAGILTAHQALAVPFSSFDPRSFAMGGAGVAAATSANAVFFNPALLAAANADEDFSVDLFGGARAADPGDMVDAVDTFSANNSIQGLNNALASYTGTNPQPVVDAANLLITDLERLSKKAVQLEADAALVIGVPSKKIGASVYINGWAVGGGVANVTDTDIQAINDVVIAVTGSPPTAPTDPTTTLTSSVSARFAVIQEVGVALARDFGGYAVGITPKYVKVKTNDYQFVGDQIDAATIDLSLGEAEDSNFNLDLGVARDLDNGLKVGLAVKNLLAQEYTTVLNNTIKIDPMARVGGVYQNSWTTVALDLDLTENDPGGFDAKSQYLALGAEFDVFDTAQFRVGVRHNMSDTPYEANTYSAGIGLSPFGVHLDLSVAGNADEMGAALQLGFRF